MSAEPVKGWDSRVLVVAESSWGTPAAPAQASEIEAISCNLGASEVGLTRPKKDRNAGRGMQSAFVEGRVQPIAFTVETTVKTRAAATTISKEAAFYNAAGFHGASNGSTAYVWTSDADPVSATDFASIGIYRALGGGIACYEAEQMRGGIIKSLQWSGGDKEVTLKAIGEGIGKYHQGYLTSISLLIGDTTMTVSAEESYRLSIGYYQIESEIIYVSAITDGGTTATITRAQISTSAAAHSSKPVYPYFPAISYTGSPISEAVVTGTLDSIDLRFMSFTVDYTTGMDMLPGESGSRFVQGVKTLRYGCTASLKTVLHREEASWLGKARARKSMALVITAGTGTGGSITFSMPQVEVDPFVVPDTAGDVVIVDLKLKGKDSATGNDMFAFTQS